MTERIEATPEALERAAVVVQVSIGHPDDSQVDRLCGERCYGEARVMSSENRAFREESREENSA
jgi:hypothetical protein